MKLRPPSSPQGDRIASEANVWAAGLKAKRPNGLRCHYCDGYANTRDHVMPRNRGGVNMWWNVVQCCFACNQAKSDDLPECRCVFCQRALKLFLRGYRHPGAVVPVVTKTEVRRAEYGWYVVLPLAAGVSFTSYWPSWRKAMDSVSGVDIPVLLG